MTVVNFDQRMVNRRPPWEGLGTTFKERVSCSAALKDVGMDFNVIKAPMFIGVPTGVENKAKLRLWDKVALIREPGNGGADTDVFGTCSPKFEVVQRSSIAKCLDPLVSRWPLESIGYMDGGKTLFFLLNAGRMEIHKDPINMYFMIVDMLDGGTSLKSIFTTIRIKCTNALLTSLKAAIVNMSINHRAGATRALSFNTEAVGKMVNSQTSTVQAFEMMARYKLTADETNRILEYIYPKPKLSAKAGLVDYVPEGVEELADIRQQGLTAVDTFDYYVNLSEQRRALALQLSTRFNDENPLLANTAWSLYQGVTESADWRSGRGNVDADALFGTRATEKRNAFKAITAGMRGL